MTTFKSVTSTIAACLLAAYATSVTAATPEDRRNAIKACKSLGAFAARTANDRFVKRIPLPDALLEAVGDSAREKIVLEAYTKGPREIGNGGRAFGEQIFLRCYSNEDGFERASQEHGLVSENESMRREALHHWAMSIHETVTENWKRPEEARAGWSCLATVKMEPTGSVQSVTIEECDGDTAFRESVRSAIESSSPLPKPAISSIWQEEIRFSFRPQ